MGGPPDRVMRLSQIDESTLGDHARLLDDDRCLYIYEYTSGKNYAFSATNNLISNLKKKPSISSEYELRYKAKAIQQCATDLRTVMNPKWLDTATIVPVPSSKAVGHPDFDDRMERLARAIRPGLDVRNLVLQTASTAAAHEVAAGERVTVEELLAVYRIDETVAAPPPQQIGVLDDVLTAGTHFRAMRTILEARFPGVPVVGLFIARRVFPPFEGFDVEL
jgi:predicted amidophosphoribosyltransferase